MSSLSAFCLIVLMPFLSGKLRLEDSLILFIISVTEVLSAGLTPLAKNLWQFYLVQAVGRMGYCKYSGTDSIKKMFLLFFILKTTLLIEPI